MKKYLIIGAGHQGLSMAGHLAINGECVNLWNRTSANIKKIKETKTIICKGIVNGVAKLNKVSDNIDEVLEKNIMITTPALAHRDIAKMLANKVDSSYNIILNPGRTFGALEFEEILRKEGCESLPKIAETQTIVYTCRKESEDTVNLIAMKNSVMISTIYNNDIKEIYECIPNCLKRYLKIVDNVLETSLNNIGLLLHCTPTLLNIGWIENPKYSFNYYTEGISFSIAKYIEKIDEERLKIGKELGVDLETIYDWFYRTYNVKGTLLECINNKAYKNIEAPNSIKHRYIEEDVPFGLVPLEHLAIELNLEVPYITNIINLASLIMEKDYRENGRNICLKKIKSFIKN